MTMEIGFHLGIIQKGVVPLFPGEFLDDPVHFIPREIAPDSLLEYSLETFLVSQ